MKRVLVTGATGFIGSHLVRDLKQRGYWVRGVDIKAPEFAPFAGDELIIADLRDYPRALEAMIGGVQDVYHLAADMGGLGWITHNDFELRTHNTHIDLNVTLAARRFKVERLFFASSACVYNETKQNTSDAPPLREVDAYPAQPDLAYGWSKLWTEQLINEATHDSPIRAYIARFHNVYGEFGTWRGGKEKSPAALCRKIAAAKLCGYRHIDVWGDGEQVRSYMHVDDCVEGIYRLVQSDHHRPINLGRDDAVTINALAKLIMAIAGVELEIIHDLSKPQGVRGRNSDNTQLAKVLNWQPSIDLQTGLTRTYNWIQSEVEQALKRGESVL